MKTQKVRRNRLTSLSNSRWAAYATAGAATAVGCVVTTEDAAAAIHYSGPINQSFSGSSTYIQLDAPGDSINPAHFGSGASGVGAFFMYQIGGNGSVAGFSGAFLKYASRLGSGINLNNLGSWVYRVGVLAYTAGTGSSEWKTAGTTGFVGFRFDGGSGLQYGWARITVDGTPGNTFTLVDFAWADFGDQISTGQTTAVPEPGSLGLLALGGAGLIAWRKRRAKAVAA